MVIFFYDLSVFLDFPQQPNKIYSFYLQVKTALIIIINIYLFFQKLQARTKVAEALSLIVRQRRSESEAGERKNDMLEALLSADDGGFSDEEIVDFLVALLVAGYETTSTIMTLAVKFLTETPLALAQLKVPAFFLTEKKLHFSKKKSQIYP